MHTQEPITTIKNMKVLFPFSHAPVILSSNPSLDPAPQKPWICFVYNWQFLTLYINGMTQLHSVWLLSLRIINLKVIYVVSTGHPFLLHYMDLIQCIHSFVDGLCGLSSIYMNIHINIFVWLLGFLLAYTWKGLVLW